MAHKAAFRKHKQICLFDQSCDWKPQATEDREETSRGQRTSAHVPVFYDYIISKCFLLRRGFRLKGTSKDTIDQHCVEVCAGYTNCEKEECDKF